MKMYRTLFLSLIIFLFCGTASAEIYLILNDANEVISAQNTDDAIPQPGQKKKVIGGTVEELGLTLPVQYYKITGDRFVQNNKKITEEQEVKDAAAELVEDEEKLNKKIKELACEAVVAGGGSFKKIKCGDFKLKK